MRMEPPHIRAYRQQQIEGASPGKLLLLTYEQALAGCRRKDRFLARRAVEELVGSLDLEQEGAGGLLVLYEWLLRLLREGEFAQAEQILEELHAAWSGALDAAG
jgi:flagellin-specific chaperone FliS